ncbi:MAG: glutamate--tRNA ligase [Desulfobacteraceae bacterium]|nr:glutamate--tRNA ligase [Desulfobacteraceae bacterium]MBC2754391.1 glutamate--tRNA ligase [Desulfobacteraceae bacterium]
MDNTIITRFPPSPTGYLHLGGARTAIFNWLYARHMNGRFILRIEDTDMQRSTQESVDAIFEAMEWLGIDWDEGPYFQSKRFDIYKEHIDRLISSGNAYYCTCTPEQVDRMREEARKSGGKPRYDGSCREKNLQWQEGAVVRFKAPLAGTTVIEDKIRGNIAFANTELDDFIIARSDGSPMYNLAVVVDDITMNINTIIRGDDHISNTPKQILLYQALGAKVPDFGHVPMVLGHDKSRLSKRHGAMSVTAYRDMGYHPDAMVNFLVRLGWSHGDQEFFTREELIEKFNLEHIGRSAGVFNPEKLLALNAEHIRTASCQSLAVHLMPFLKEKGIQAETGDYLYGVIETLKPRSKTFVEMADGAEFYFQEKPVYDETAAAKFLKPELLDPVKQLADGISGIAVFDEKNLEDIFKQVMEDSGLGFGKVAQPVRVALTGKTISPGIFEMILALGKENVISRLYDAVQFMEKAQAAE